MLNEKQIKQFKEDGFVLVPELFNKSDQYGIEIINAGIPGSQSSNEFARDIL